MYRCHLEKRSGNLYPVLFKTLNSNTNVKTTHPVSIYVITIGKFSEDYKLNSMYKDQIVTILCL